MAKKKRQKGRKKPPGAKKQIRRDISFLPSYTEIVLGSLQQTQEQLDTFLEAKSKPHVLDDATVNRALNLYEEQLDFIPLHYKQFDWWLTENLSDAQRYQVEDLRNKLPSLEAKTQELLDLLAELKKGTIDQILKMSDEELALKILSGELKAPF